MELVETLLVQSSPGKQLVSWNTYPTCCFCAMHSRTLVVNYKGRSYASVQIEPVSVFQEVPGAVVVPGPKGWGIGEIPYISASSPLPKATASLVLALHNLRG